MTDKAAMEKLDEIQSDIRFILQKIDSMTVGLNQRLDAMNENFNHRLDAVHLRIDGVHSRIDSLILIRSDNAEQQ